jgi:Tfp pilus assembly protein PilF
MAMATAAEALALGLEHHLRGELTRAEPIYRQVLAYEPQNIKALKLLAALSMQSSRFDEGMALLERVAVLDAGTVESLCNLGTAYLQARRLDDALRTFDEAVRLHPLATGPLYNRALALTEMQRFDESVADYLHCLELDSNHLNALNNLGNLLRRLGKLEDALGYFERALVVDPNFPMGHYNRAVTLLAMGRLAEGFAEHEWRLRCDAFKTRKFAQTAWDGSPLASQTLLVHTEQGLGDTIQFVRYMPLVAQRVGQVIFGVSPPLVALLAQSGYRGLLVEGSPLPPFDVQLPLPSLPHVLGTTLETIPAKVPYLAASPRLVDQWRARLAAYDGFKVGIVWQGTPTYPGDRYRSISLACFAPLAAVSGVRLLSLQKGTGIEQIAALQGAFDVVDLGSQIDNESGAFMDTAAIMKNLDLVVTSDTSCAHLAGALNVNVWIALGYSPDWRWLRGRDDSPWYPSARLFRQPAFGEWPAVFQAMARELRQKLGDM